MYEFQNGCVSPMRYFLDYLPDADFFYDWEIPLKLETQCIDLLQSAQNQRNRNLALWDSVSEVLKRYSPSVFQEKILTFEVFKRFYAIVCTRAFGRPLPSSSLVPMADNFNHANNYARWKLINRNIHLTANSKNSYFSPDKFMSDYTHLYD
jgi:hypothetical protein